jgi:hypothetical protein
MAMITFQGDALQGRERLKLRPALLNAAVVHLIKWHSAAMAWLPATSAARFPAQAQFYFQPQRSKPALRPTKPPIQRVQDESG